MRTECRLVNMGILGAWLTLLPYFSEFPGIYHQTPLLMGFFPALLRSAPVFAAAWLVPMLGAGLVLRFPEYLRYQLGLWVVASLVLLWHQGSYNDATFVTSFWAALWALWASGRAEESQQDRQNAILLAKLIISMIFLGGVVGKFTAGYWDGTVLYEIYFRQRDFWTFNIARSLLDADQLRTAATIYSRIVSVSELAAVFVVLVPNRGAFILYGALLLLIPLLSNWYLFSVVFSVMGLAAAGHRLATSPGAVTATLAP